MTEPTPPTHPTETARLGMWDAVSIIVGIVVGTAIYKTPHLIYGNVSSAWMGLGAWLLGGVLSFVGALCYAELATAYPRMGGDYVYLSRAFGRPVGFLFGWAQLAVILTGSIGVMAFAFGDYTVRLWSESHIARSNVEAGTKAERDEVNANDVAKLRKDLESSRAKGDATGTERLETEVAFVESRILAWDKDGDGKATSNEVRLYFETISSRFAVAAVLVLSLLNLAGLVFGKQIQNVLTGVKVLGLLAIVVVGLSSGGGGASFESTKDIEKISFGFAMVMVLYAFGGWNDAAFVASEVRDRSRNIPKALLYGIGGITVIYLLVNLGYIWGIGFDGLRSNSTPAAEVLKGPFGENGGRVMSILVMLSALGAVNGLIFTGSRIYTALGREHSVFKFLGHWDPRLGVPIWSIVVQAVIAILLILAVGTPEGRSTVDSGLQSIRLAGLPWDQYFGGFDTLVAGTAPVFWIFFLLTALALFKLREMDHGIPRPFSVPLYPFVPFIFGVTCVYMLYSSLAYAKGLALIGIVPLLVGLPLYFISRHTPDKS
jgi:amino acid transporter